MGNINLTEDQKKIVEKVNGMIEANGGSIEHDMSDPLHRDYVKLMHNLAGNSENEYPGLHKLLGNHKASAGKITVTQTDGWETSFAVPEVGKALNTNLAAANGYGTVVGGFKTCNLSLLVRDSGGAFIAFGSNAGQLPLNSLGVKTYNNQAKPASEGMKAQMTYTYQPLNGGTPVSGTVFGDPPKMVADPVVTEPKRESGNTDPYDRSAINIGLGRPPGYLTKCDYIYNEPVQSHPVGRMPLVGSVTLTQPIQPLHPGNNFLVDIYIIRTDSGGKSIHLEPADMKNIYDNFFIDPADPTGKTLRWNLPMEANVAKNTENARHYNPVVFQNIPWSSNMKAYLTVNITVTREDGIPIIVTIQSSDAPDGDPLDGIAYIMPIEFIWHCLGEETMVTLPDGSEKQITEITTGTEIKGPEFTEKVTVTHNGSHTGKVLKIKTDQGNTLTCSTKHLIVTQEGACSADLLRVGDIVMTLDGTAKISEIEALSVKNQTLWNLSLGEAPGIDEESHELNLFYANGILVGDAGTERAMKYARAKNIDWVKAHFDKSFHKDIESTFKKRKTLSLR